LDRLCQRIIWPSDLAVPADDHLEIMETSRTLSPFVLDSGRIGNRINWLMTAIGRAYLAFRPADERQRIVARLRKTRTPQDRLAAEPKRFDAILAETRERGYGLRDAAFYGGFYAPTMIISWASPSRCGAAAASIAASTFSGRAARSARSRWWHSISPTCRGTDGVRAEAAAPGSTSPTPTALWWT
jgi:DNA-binding IclR family transcriptional regulator